MMPTNNEYLQFELAGKDKKLYSAKRDQFINAIEEKVIDVINNFLNALIDKKNTEELPLKKYMAPTSDFGSQSVQIMGFDNAKIMAEVEYLYSQKKKEDATTDAIELETELKRLIASLSLSKIILEGEGSNRSLFFIKNIDNFLMTINK